MEKKNFAKYEKSTKNVKKPVKWVVAVKTQRARKFTLFGFDTKKNALGFMDSCAINGGCQVAISRAE